MNTLTHRLMLAAILMAGMLSSQPLHAAATVAVGTCQSTTPHYATIQQAVNAVSYGGTVLVCPGNYGEQVIITQSLTLKGIASGKAQAATIVTPGNGMTLSFTSPSIANVTAHLYIQSANPVTISNMSIQGEGVGCPLAYSEVGIASINSNTTVINTAIRHISSPEANCFGVALFEESSGVLNVQGSSINGFENGLWNIDGSGTISSNFFSDGLAGISYDQATAPVTISGNTFQTIGCPSTCTTPSGTAIVFAAVGNSSIVNNTIGLTPMADTGIFWDGSATVTGNKISGGVYGMQMQNAKNSTVQSNILTNSAVGLKLIDGTAGSNVITKNTFKYSSCGLWTVATVGDTLTPNTYLNNNYSTCP